MARALGLALAALAATAQAQNNSPSQFHIALAGSGMRVAFKTNETTSAPVCNFGTTPTALSNTATGAPGKGYLAGHGYHNAVLLPNLPAATRIYYACAGDASSSFSSTFSFVTPPAPTSVAANFSLAIFGDMGFEDSKMRGSSLPVGGLQTNWSATLTRQLLEGLRISNRISGVFHIGDMAYADDSFGHLDTILRFTYEDCYDGWMDWMQNVSATMPYMVLPGNHESECHSPACFLDLEGLGLKLNNFTAYNARWAMPSAESGGVASMWYSWDMGGVHFVSIDTSTDFPGAPEGTTGDSKSPLLPAGRFAPDGVYYAWLEADLAKAAADPHTRWIVVAGHRPFEDFNTSDTVLAPLFKKYGVAMYFAGHAHSYSRYDVSAWADGAVHVTVGGAGCDEMPYPADQLSADWAGEEQQEGRPQMFTRAPAHVGLPQPSSGMLASQGAQMITDPVLGCQEWCTRPEVRRGFLDHRDGSSEPCRYCSVGPKRVEEAVAAVAAALESKAPSRAELRARALASGDASALKPVAAPPPAADFFSAAAASGSSPVYFSDKMAIGVLHVTDAALTWQLLRAPDGVVLDEVVVNRAAK